ncbi:hypothetical protein LX36DRAFT_704290 [Colletotrichum falcatum]|nr:hypothetical protein LX36DRAFT_704290 [Colletotrichum falcatum]
MPKKAKGPSGSKEKAQRATAEKPGEEAAAAPDGQNKPVVKVSEDDKGRKLTVIMGTETEMDKLWFRLQMAQALRNQLIHDTFQFRSSKQELDGPSDNGPIKIKITDQMEKNFERLQNRIIDAIHENNKAVFEEFGIHAMDLFPFYSLPAPVADEEQVVTGFEDELSKAVAVVAALRAAAEYWR